MTVIVGREHISRHTGRPTGRLHIPHRHRNFVPVPVTAQPTMYSNFSCSKWSCTSNLSKAVSILGIIGIVAGITLLVLGAITANPFFITAGIGLAIVGTLAIPLSLFHEHPIASSQGAISQTNPNPEKGDAPTTYQVD